ncbi:MAG: hypothetical protein EOP38_00680 [Rubrivivax sp.]|nr:MAG: hypothetical protein EOP38_00680 [Rubrivivax sp.]
MGASTHIALPIEEISQIGDARRRAAALADKLAFDAVAAGRVALVVTELATNLVRHAKGGQLLLAVRGEGTAEAAVEVLSIDRGPGIASMAACLEDGFSTGGTAGTGLGAIRRQADEFDAYADASGTLLVARVRAARATPSGPPAVAGPVISHGGISLCAPGEMVCGDQWAFVGAGAQAALIVADGLGHGPIAAEAALAAVAVFEAEAVGQSPSRVLELAHAALRSTRGAAVSVARMDGNTVSYAGAGNVAGRLVSALDSRSLVAHHGTLGLQVRKLQDFHYDWTEHALLILHSDGLATRWDLQKVPGLLQRDPSLIAAFLIRDHCRGKDDVAVVVVRRRVG